MTAHLSGIVPSPASVKDYRYMPVPGVTQDFISVRQWAGDVKDQGAQGNCVGNSGANCVELIELQATGEPIRVSRQFPYDVARIWEERRGQAGMFQRDMLEVLRKLGVPLEADYAYRGDEQTIDPPAAVYALAAQRKLMRYELIDPAELEYGIRSALAEGCPVIISFEVGRKLFDANGPLERQDYGPVHQATNPSAGYHDAVIVEWNARLASFVIENSWGTGYGERGFQRFPAAALVDCFEARAIRGFNGHYIEPRLVSDEGIRAAVQWLLRDGFTEAAAQQIWDGKVQYGISSAHLEHVMQWPPGSVDQFARARGWL